MFLSYTIVKPFVNRLYNKYFVCYDEGMSEERKRRVKAAIDKFFEKERTKKRGKVRSKKVQNEKRQGLFPDTGGRHDKHR